MQNAMMFNLARYNMRQRIFYIFYLRSLARNLFFFYIEYYTLNCQIITLCGAGSKNYFFRLATKKISRLLSGVFNCFAGFPANLVRGRSIAELFAKIRLF